MNENVKVFKPEPVTITLGDKEYVLKYDLNAFCELEKYYDSIDDVLQMLLGTSSDVDLSRVTYNGITIAPDEVQIDGVPLTSYMAAQKKIRTAKHSDTLILLWAGTLHNHCRYGDDGEINGYTITRAELGKEIGFANLREVNGKIATAILRDLIPVLEEETKNVKAQEPASATPLLSLS